MSSWNGLTRDKIEHAINQYIIGRNAERNRKILYDKLIIGLTFEMIAEKHDLSVTQVKRIVYKGTDEIFKHTEVK